MGRSTTRPLRPLKKRVGRPKGSKNKPKKAGIDQSATIAQVAAALQIAANTQSACTPTTLQNTEAPSGATILQNAGARSAATTLQYTEATCDTATLQNAGASSAAVIQNAAGSRALQSVLKPKRKKAQGAQRMDRNEIDRGLQGNDPKKMKTKDALEKIIARCADPEATDFDVLDRRLIRKLKLEFPMNSGWDKTYKRFTLFWPEHLWNIIADHTNQRAVLQEAQEGVLASNAHERPWYRATAEEITVFMGISLYMGIHHSREIADYWMSDGEVWAPLHPIRSHMTLDRYCQLRRFLHLSNPLATNSDRRELTDEEDEMDPEEDESNPEEGMNRWWDKMEPFASIFRQACQIFRVHGTNMSVDAMMFRSYGRTSHRSKFTHL